MFLPRIAGSIPRRHDLHESHLPFYAKPIRAQSVIRKSPQAGYAESIDLSECKLLNAKRRSTFTKKHFSESFRTDLSYVDKRQILNRKLKSLTLKKTTLEVKRLAYERKVKIAESLSLRYGIQFKLTEVHLLSEEQLESLALAVYTKQCQTQACKVIQRSWRRHRILKLKRTSEERLQRAAKLIQRQWGRYKV